MIKRVTGAAALAVASSVLGAPPTTGHGGRPLKLDSVPQPCSNASFSNTRVRKIIVRCADLSQYLDTGPPSQYTLSWMNSTAPAVDDETANQAMGFAELEEHIRAQTSPPELTITFDDGHRSNLQAATELAELGIRATVFVTPSFCIDRSDFLKPAELRALHRIADVGAHGYTHRPLTALDRRVLDREIVDCKAWLEDILGAEVRYMAAPGGYINDRNGSLSAGYHLSAIRWNGESSQATRCFTRVNRVSFAPGWLIDILKQFYAVIPSSHEATTAQCNVGDAQAGDIERQVQ